MEEVLYCNVSAANVWTNPDKVRDIDLPSLTAPVRLKEWLHALDVELRRDLVGRLESQLLFGEPVLVLEKQGDWCKVCAPLQFDPKDERGYPGWVPLRQLASHEDFHHRGEQDLFAWVTSDTALLTLEDETQMELSFMTRLPWIGESDGQVLVLTPNGETGRIPCSDVWTGARLPVRDAGYRIHTAKRFLGLPYLWAGMSSFGFDCSGFVHRIFAAGGITIPRDANIQAKYGEAVKRDQLQPGDLVFFAHEEGAGAIHHVGMYIKEGRFIHSPNSGNPVRINALTDDPYGREFCGGARYTGKESFLCSSVNS
ncbi:peptidase P60 [Marinithermofilum abyssi]|uniref:Peptidase P60 n=1 Tax=Marinithermofilum abyssi TaxID=1571185 RepID=A0A8J2YD62_9BACL|nr:C40 family peptidase [Marinithermofilum abyssi]GGE14972.1 peptidase P60 [Marinithermofilum abyssi]